MDDYVSEQSVLPEDKEVGGSEFLVFRPEMITAPTEYKVERYLGLFPVEYVKNGKIVKAEPCRWLINNGFNKFSLSEWSVRIIGKTSASALVGKTVILKPLDDRKVTLEVKN